VLPGWLTGIGWSDQWSFWKEDYPAIMITDKPQCFATLTTTGGPTRRNKIDYDRMVRVVSGMSGSFSTWLTEADRASSRRFDFLE